MLSAAFVIFALEHVHSEQRRVALPMTALIGLFSCEVLLLSDLPLITAPLRRTVTNY